MPPRLAALLTMLVFAFTPAALASGKAENKASLSLHVQAEATDNPKMIFAQLANGKTQYFRRMPEFTTKDVASFSPFPSDAGGDDYGIVFKLKDTAAKRLAAISNINQGRWMIAQVNGRVVDGVLIDKQIDDGLVVVWKGVALADVNVFDAALPRIGQVGKKKNK